MKLFFTKAKSLKALMYFCIFWEGADKSLKIKRVMVLQSQLDAMGRMFCFAIYLICIFLNKLIKSAETFTVDRSC